MEKKKYYKNGNPAHYKSFSDDQYKSMTPAQQSMWTPWSEHEPAPIPQEVIDFTKKNNLNEPENPVYDPCCKDDKCKKLEARVAELEAENERLRQDGNSTLEAQIEKDREEVKKKLTELGVPFRANTGLAKLMIKLEEAENANNTE